MPAEPPYAPPGAVTRDGETSFTVWAPHAASVEVHLVHPYDKVVALEPSDRGYFHERIADAGPGSRYFFRLDGDRELPDPASRSQPEGVHGPSEVASTDFGWSDEGWAGLPLSELVVYELHVGAFTADGTFDAVVPVLDDLVALGVTAVELMPVAQFPGERNWGYDGVYPYAPQASYGGPEGLKRLVDACHGRGLAVVLDAVYNHFGPEGCYVDAFGPYFTDRYKTPWGRAINFDGGGSDEVRRFFIANALYWFDEFHIDALRLDAVHAIADTSAYPFVEELAVATDDLAGRMRRELHLIAESADNDARLITPRGQGGLGVHAQWSDDFHHALRTLITSDRSGYYADYGTIEHFARAFAEGFAYQGQFSAFRQRRHGRPSGHLQRDRFVVFANNHDQVGNRPLGDRMTTEVGLEELKLAAGAVLLSGFVPLLFMGEEYGEKAPFLYFVSHSSAELVEAVRRGRAEEFEGFRWTQDPPDPQDERTFLASKIDRRSARAEPHATLLRYYTELLRLRRELPALMRPQTMRTETNGRMVAVHRSVGRTELLTILNFEGRPIHHDLPGEDWEALVDSADAGWGGPRPADRAFVPGEPVEPMSVVLLRRAA